MIKSVVFSICVWITFTSSVFSQKLEIVAVVDIPEDVDPYHVWVEGDEIFILDENDGIKFTRLKQDGKYTSKSTKYESDNSQMFAIPQKIENKLIFTKVIYEKKIVRAYIVEYDITTNKVGEPKEIAAIPSPSDPSYYCRFEYSDNNKFIGFFCVSGKGSVSQGTFTSSSYTMVMINDNYDKQWEKTFTYDYSEDEFSYHENDFIDDEGQWISFGRFIESKKGGVEKSFLAATIHHTDGTISGPIKSNWSSDNSTNDFWDYTNDKFIICGTWGNNPKHSFSHGTYYVELDKNTLQVITEKKHTFSEETLQKFITNNWMKKQIEKGEGIYRLVYDGFMIFDDGSYAFALRRTAPESTGSEFTEHGTIIVAKFGPNGSTYNEYLIRLDHTSIWIYNGIASRAFICGENICVAFNDYNKNAAVIEETPVAFKPRLNNYDDLISSIVIITPEGKVTRENFASMAEDNYIYFGYMEEFENGEILLSMIENPKNNNYDGTAPSNRKRKYMVIKISD